MPQDAYATPAIVASGTTWAQLKAGGVAAVLANLATNNPAKSNPSTTATAASSVASGGLAAGTYYVSYSFVDPFGETLAGGRSAQFTSTGLAQLWTITLPALPTGVQSINLYVTPTNGAAGTETLYATGITATTFAMSYTPPADQGSATLPAANTTGWPSALAGAMTPTGNTELILYTGIEHLSAYLAGDGPSPRQRKDIIGLYRYAGILKAWYTVWNEIGTLIAANMPTGTTRTTMGTGMPFSKWTLP